MVLVRLQLAPADGGTRTQAAQLQAAQHPDGSTALRALKRLTDAELAEHLAAAAGRGGARTSPRWRASLSRCLSWLWHFGKCGIP